MFIEKEFYIGFRDLDFSSKLCNTGLLSYLEDIGGFHSNLTHTGLLDIPTTKKSWVLLAWKVNLYKRPIYSETVKIKTWSRAMDKLYAYRDFEIYCNDELIGIATSKWILIDIESRKILKLDEELAEKYKQENIDIMNIGSNFGKLSEPETYTYEAEYKITKNLIDINEHVHNLYYLDIAEEVIPEDVLKSGKLNNFEILYKKEIKKDETVKCLFEELDDSYVVTIKSLDKTVLHCIIKYYK